MSDYEKFQLQWMIDREHPLRELIKDTLRAIKGGGKIE